MLDLKPHELEVVRNILNRFVPEAEIIVSGSRIYGTAKPWSDLDLAIKRSKPNQRSTGNCSPKTRKHFRNLNCRSE